MGYNFVWFDIGYTLLYIKREEPFRTLLAEFGYERSLEEVDRAFHSVAKLFMREYPGVLGRPFEHYLPWYMGFLCNYLDIDGDVFSICVRWKEIWRSFNPLWHPYPQALPTIKKMISMGLGVGIISNWDLSARSVLADAGLLDFINPCIISSEVGFSKPSKEIFNIALEKAGGDAAKSLYIGDNYYDDALGAASVGMDSLIINRFGKFGVEELQGQKLINNVAEVLPFIEKGYK
ncbi:MAG TPA: haloacid dehalogenase [Spirochaetaceae bacterium]|jgi:putative hydrolase of the HAD superfamily|nr:haloacid dehalogenase [Spirochaetaceae bacterium]HOI22367.1 HAD family hydrolase [Spirochaetales bacterium]